MTVQDYKVVQLIRTLARMNLDLEFSDVRELWNTTMHKHRPDSEAKAVNWQMASRLLRKLLLMLLSNKSIPERGKAALVELISKMQGDLKGLFAVKACVGEDGLEMTFKKWNIFKLIPDMQALLQETKGKD